MCTTKAIMLIIILSCTVNASFAQKKAFYDSIYSFSSDLSPDVIHITPAAFHYIPYNGQKINFGLITHNRWCYVVIKIAAISANKDYVLSVDNTSIDTVLLYALTKAGAKEERYSGGNMVPYNTARKYVWHSMPVKITDNECYYLAVFQDQGKNVNVGYKIMPLHELDKLYSSFDRLIWFYMGVVFLLIVAVVYGWFIFRNKALGYYILYMICVAAWILAHYGYLYPMLYHNLPVLNGVIKPLSICWALLSFCYLLRALFIRDVKSDRFAATILQYITRTGLILTATFVVYLFIPKHGYAPTLFNLVWHTYFIISFLGILFVLKRLLEKSTAARLFALAMGIMVLMSVQQVLSNSGVFHNTFLNDHGMLLASMAEMMVLTCATFLNIWEDRRRIARHVVQLEEEHSRTLEQLVTVQDNERRRIAGELHDSIGPMLAALKINFQLITASAHNGLPVQLVAKTEDILDGSMAEIRNISHQLMPKGLSSEGLIVSLSGYFSDLREVYKIPVQFHHSITASLHKDVQLNVYRIMCELVLNAAKHSKASCISAAVETPGGAITVTVKDDGRGFNPSYIKEETLGLSSIESRVNYLKGNLKIESAPGEGACITIAIPKKID
ncbi:MAG: sensor histidine kinase [Agriterribacter sp.]